MFASLVERWWVTSVSGWCFRGYDRWLDMAETMCCFGYWVTALKSRLGWCWQQARWRAFAFSLTSSLLKCQRMLCISWTILRMSSVFTSFPTAGSRQQSAALARSAEKVMQKFTVSAGLYLHFFSLQFRTKWLRDGFLRPERKLWKLS